jgi:energy-converting hydrogenase Eha subunit C
MQEDMVKTPATLLNFIKSSKSKNPITLVAVFFKYISVVLLKKQLNKSINYHLVPSKFMEQMVTNSYSLDSKKVQTLSHFIQ